MATQWGNNSLGPGSAASFFFNRGNSQGFLPYISVIPTSPSFTPEGWTEAADGYPSVNELGVSTLWSRLSDDETGITYYLVIENRSNNAVEYSFVEADF
jgi:hypothetical protein